MAKNFNVDPWYDDFDQTKNFHRILFKPGRAVQARELTQAQTILQDQITKFADNIFKQNSPVTGGEITTNFDCYYIKLQPTYNNAAIDITQFDGILVRNTTGNVVARVLTYVPATGTDTDTLIVSYKSGEHFQDGDVIYEAVNGLLAAQAITSSSTGKSSVASISQGVFYVLGNFVQISSSTKVIDPYDNTPTKRIGLTITETTYDYVDDNSLLDPAAGATNYQAPGADRYVIALSLDTRNIALGDDNDFIELVRVEDGIVSKMVDGSVYNVIDDYFAKRDYETNGDYIVDDYKLTPRTNTDEDLYTLTVGKGLAYVHGHRIENPTNVDLVSNRARTTKSQTNNPIFIDYGTYFYVNTVRGGAGGSFFDITTAQPVDFHCVTSSNVITTNTATYNSTVVATGYIRNFAYDHNTSDADANTYVYKAFVNDIQNAVATANVVSATSNTIKFPGTFSQSNTSYVGVNITITNGTSAGDFRTITSYNGATRVATVNQNWTVTPDTTSVFALNFDIKDIDTIVYADKTSYPAAIKSYANINDNSGRIGGVSTGATSLKNPGAPELIYNVGAPYVASLVNASYNTQQLNRGVVFNASGGSFAQVQITYSGSYTGVIKHLGTAGDYLSSDVIKQNFLIVVTNSVYPCTLVVGQVVPLSSIGGTILISEDSSTATLSIPVTSIGGGFTATVLEKVYVTNADNSSHFLKYKNLITADTSVIKTNGTNINGQYFVDDAALTSTGQIYIQNPGLVAPGSKQTLYLSDVKNIVKIIDTKGAGYIPTLAMLTDPIYDITNNYTFDNGQRDGYYDHASITLIPGAPQPKGNLLVFVNYYQHTGGDGYFALSSYLDSQNPETYKSIPTYVSKNGKRYPLRDSLDFRPSRTNATTDFQFNYNNVGTNYGMFIPNDLSTFTTDYSYYLGRKDKLVLTKDRTFQIIEGSASVNPLFPSEPDGSLVVANISHTPYTGYIPTEAPAGTISDLSIEKVKHKRYTMQDIAGLESRINNIQYYASLNLLEQKASSLQISDAYGLNRFKNGILVDDFSSFSTADTLITDYHATINRRDRFMTASQNVKNFPLKSLATAYNMNQMDSSISLGYNISKDGDVNYYTLPYTTANVITQKFASRTVNVNPFSFSIIDGTVSLSPNIDNWVDTTYSPALLITDPNLQVFQASSTNNILQYGDWKAITGVPSVINTQLTASGGNWQTFTQTTSVYQNQTNVWGPYDKIGNTYSLNNGYIQDISVLPYIRPQQIVSRAKSMLINTSVNYYFDGTNINNYVRKANIIELTGVSGTFSEGDVIGYYTSGSFTPTARILGVFNKTATTTRLYVAADPYTSNYTTNGVIQNGFFNAAGVYTSTTATGTVSSTTHFGGRIIGTSSSTSITLSNLASTTDNYYNGNTIYICDGTGVGTSSVISSYAGSTRVATLSNGITVSVGDIYSIGGFSTDETGSTYGVFLLPENTFHNGQRTLRIDNRVNGNKGTETTFAEGTFYSEGLQTKAQQIDFGASPSGAKGTFNKVGDTRLTVVGTTSWTNRWDPVAQTFIVDKDNYPNGLFLDSATFFFSKKPTGDNSPITLSIVGTQNGYPNGDTLDHSVVTLTPISVKTSSTPQILDTTAATKFKFSAPVYIQPGVLYAFMLKSNSNQYELWSASNGDAALSSSVKNLPSDPAPSIITKISSAPYVGGLFISQNSQTWTADQNQSLMFVVDRCKFSTTATPTIQHIVPNKLPQRTLIDQSIKYYQNANGVSSATDTVTSTDILVDAFNITTTDFTPSSTYIRYSYNATLLNGTAAGTTYVNPGKYGTPTNDDIYLTDGKGERILQANSNTSFSLYTVLNTTDDSVSPVISDAGLSVFSIKWDINNAELSNSVITLANPGTSYNVLATSVIVSAPTDPNGSQAYASANIVSGNVQSVYITTPGSGYITTPTITIVDSSMEGSGASVVVTGETSKNGGNVLAKYITKKVVLDPTFDSGDLNVYLTAYRPVKTDIHVYYKVLNRNDTQKFDDSSWQLMTKINNSGSLYSQSRSDTYEYVFAPGTSGVDQGYIDYTSETGQTYTSFSQFAIKVVLTSSDHTYVPFATDLRVIALPSNVNTSV
jgi:hypothetical protein